MDGSSASQATTTDHSDDREPAFAAGPLGHAEIRAAGPPPPRRGPSGPRFLKMSSILAERRGGRRRPDGSHGLRGPPGLLAGRRAVVTIGRASDRRSAPPPLFAAPWAALAGHGQPDPVRKTRPNVSCSLYRVPPRQKNRGCGHDFSLLGQAPAMDQDDNQVDQAFRAAIAARVQSATMQAMGVATLVLDAAGLDASEREQLEAGSQGSRSAVRTASRKCAWR